MFNRLFPLLSLLVLAGCAQSGPVTEVADNEAFQKQVEAFFKSYWDLHPGMASAEGLSQYDGILDVPTEENRQTKLKFYKENLSQFEAVKAKELSAAQRSDRSLLINQMKKWIWYAETLKIHQWNPAAYNLAPQISQVIEKRHRPLEERLTDVSKKLEKAKDYYAAAQLQIQKPTREHLNLAIQQTQGSLTYLKSDLKKELQKSKLSRKEKKDFAAKLSGAQAATQSYLSFLKGLLRSPQSVGGFSDFRIGPELYRTKFELDLQIDLTPQQLYRRALEAKEEARSKMFELAIELYPKYFGDKLPPKDRQEVMRAVLNKV